MYPDKFRMAFGRVFCFKMQCACTVGSSHCHYVHNITSQKYS